MSVVVHVLLVVAEVVAQVTAEAAVIGLYTHPDPFNRVALFKRMIKEAFFI